MSPKPKTAVPSETTATVWPLIVYLNTLFLSSAICLQGSATPGVYAIDKSSLSWTATLDLTPSFPLFCS